MARKKFGGVLGAKALYAALKKFPEGVHRNILRGAVFEGSKVIAAAVQAKAAQVIEGGWSSPYVRAIKTQRPRGGRAARFAVIGGVILNPRVRALRIWHLLEFGHKGMSKEGPIFVEARPHWRPGLEQSEGPAVDVLVAYIANRIPREVKKLAKKAGR